MSAIEKIFTSAPGRAVASKAGLKDPPQLRRGRTWPQGAIVLADLNGSTVGRETLVLLGRSFDSPIIDSEDGDAPGYGAKIGAIVVDATTLTTIADLEKMRAVLRPAVRALEGSGRVVILARPAAGDWEQRSVTRALDGINRTVAKELRKGATSTLLYVDHDATPSDLLSTMGFALQGRSAFVDGQTWQVSAADTNVNQLHDTPLDGRTIVVTGAARGIGAAIARSLAQAGAHILAIDIPPAGEALAEVANEIGGTALQLDITADDAGTKIADHIAFRGLKLYGIVHNAGITRDKMLVNTDKARWDSVLDVNLAAQMRINEVLLARRGDGGIEDGGRIIGVASTSGLAGNKGQTNYAASKAGVAGLVQAMAPDLADRAITVNAVAPGFIETEMTGKIPFVQREIFRRSNSLSQGGQPIDVAETIGYFLDPASQGVNGQVVRVCGQNLVGA
ncbi:3-oxoacyl-ACP reductase [Demequina sediminicola]|uniref:3-oxoacyl-ACP reductase n=1 Tax=Demequina sediminicola TaxID=1095026 RepID=UPI0007864942|nr:3-oxoacyl-ACP reductase [Demequina sediminicola]